MGERGWQATQGSLHANAHPAIQGHPLVVVVFKVHAHTRMKHESDRRCRKMRDLDGIGVAAAPLIDCKHAQFTGSLHKTRTSKLRLHAAARSANSLEQHHKIGLLFPIIIALLHCCIFFLLPWSDDKARSDADLLLAILYPSSHYALFFPIQLWRGLHRTGSCAAARDPRA